MSFSQRKKTIFLLKQVLKRKIPLFALEEEISFLSPLFYRSFLGVLEKKNLLDFILEKFSRGKFKAKGEVYYHLLLSLYMILFLDSSGDKTIKEAVDFSRKKYGQGSSNFLYSLLKKAFSIYYELNTCKAEFDELSYLNLFYSLPGWMAREFLKKFDFSYLEKKFTEQLPVWGRLLKGNKEEFQMFCEREGIKVEFLENLSRSFRLFSKTSFFLKKMEGTKFLVYFQDLASQIFLERIRKYLKGENFLDVCCGNGGKGLVISSNFSFSNIVLNELDPKRNKVLKERVSKLDLKGVKVLNYDFSRKIKDRDLISNKFDVVLVDVPCSGLGTIQRHPEIRYLMEEEKAMELWELQKKILMTTLKMVAKNSIIIYSTCTVSERENEKMLEWLNQEEKLKLLEKDYLWPDGSSLIFYGVLKKDEE